MLLDDLLQLRGAENDIFDGILNSSYLEASMDRFSNGILPMELLYSVCSLTHYVTAVPLLYLQCSKLALRY
jgi:hypothetical protein